MIPLAYGSLNDLIDDGNNNEPLPVVHYKEFPFEEIRNEAGDYFRTINALLDLGFETNQIWSVNFTDGDDPAIYGTYTYGPSYHSVDLLGYIATKESHDNNTYYNERIDMADFEGRAHGELPG